MKPVLTFLLTSILFCTPFQGPEVFDVVVTEISKTHITIVWDGGSSRINRAEWARGSYRFWPKQVVKGQLLKATFLVGRLKSVPSCQERLNEAIKDYKQGLDVKYPVNSLMPEDCSRAPSKFIQELLERVNR